MFEGDEVQALSPNELVRRGCIQVMEGRHCFAHLTIEENLLTGAFTRRDGAAAIRRDLDWSTPISRGSSERRDVAGRLHVGRRAADVRDRPRADVAAEDDPARRAVDGARAADRRGDFRDRAATSTPRRASRSCSPSRTPAWRCKYARYGYILENGRVVMDGDAKALRRERGRQGVLPRHRRGQAQIFRDGKHYSAASAGWRKPRRMRWPESISTTLETRDPAERERDLFARLPRRWSRARCRRRAGRSSSQASIRNRVTSRAALAKLPVLRKSDCSALQKRTRRSAASTSPRPARRGALLMSPGPIFEPEGTATTLAARRARCSPPASAPATSCTTRSPITSRPAASFSKRARMRSAARSFPAASAIPSSSSRRSRTTSRAATSARRIF